MNKTDTREHRETPDWNETDIELTRRYKEREKKGLESVRRVR